MSRAAKPTIALALLLVCGAWSWIDRPVAAVEAGNRAFARGDFAAAAADYQEALADGNEARAHYDRGLALYRLALGKNGNERAALFRSAAASLARAAASGPAADRSRALTALGNVALRQGDPSGAIAAYSRALAADPDNDLARDNLLLARRQQREAASSRADASEDPDTNGDADDETSSVAGDPGSATAGGAESPGSGDGSGGEATPAASDGDGGSEPGPSPSEALHAPSMRAGDVRELSDKLDALERRSRELRRELWLRRRSPQSQGGPTW